MTETNQKSVAVVTTTIGRNTLEKAIISIQNQTYPCTHYIFVDGKAHWEKVKHLEEKYPNVIFTFLPMNTGGENNIGNGAIHAILPYLLKEEIFCFLDDDNWHDPNHVEYLVNLIHKHNLDYAYSLRWFYTDNYEMLCEDNNNSIGFWNIKVGVPFSNEKFSGIVNNNSEPLIDTNSYAITRKISFKLAEQWYSGASNDKAVFKQLKAINARGGFTGKRTTHYKLEPIFNKQTFTKQNIYFTVKQQSLKVAEAGYTFTQPALFIDGQIQFLIP